MKIESEVLSIPTSTGKIVFRWSVKIVFTYSKEFTKAQIVGIRSKSAYGLGCGFISSSTDLGNKIGAELFRLISTPTHNLTYSEIGRKSTLISFIDPLNSDIGLKHETHRWLYGEVKGNKLVLMDGFGEIEIPEEILGDFSGICMGKIPIHRDGWPNGEPVESLK